MSKPLGPSRVKKIFNGTELVLKMCETKNNEWKRYMLLIRDGIDNYIKTTIITSNFASLNKGEGQKSPVKEPYPRFGVYPVSDIWRPFQVLCKR